jgi:HlyD family secretion protein
MIRSRTRGGRYAAGAAGALVLSTALASCGQPAPQPETARVERSPVVVKVSASGALTSVETQGVGFRVGAQLKEINVKVGDKVVAGQQLGRIDDFRVKNLRDSALFTSRNAKGNLDRALTRVVVINAQKALDQAERSFDKTKSSVAASIEAADDAKRRAKVRFVRDLDILEDQLNKGGVPTDCRARYGPDKLTSTDRFTQDPNAGVAQVPPPDSMVPLTGVPSQVYGAMSNDCNPANNAAIITAFNNAFLSKSALVTADNATITARKAGQVTIEGSRTSLVAARNARRLAEEDLPITIRQLQALYDASLLALANANQDLKDTVLFAPVAGTVATVNGVIGEYIGSGSGSSAQSPGTTAPIPGVGAAASSDQAGNAASGISATRPGGSAFVTLNNLDTFQAVVPFEESDAAKVVPGQKVDVTFDSLPDLKKVGTVQSKAPSGVNISGVTNYYVTVLLDSGDPRLTTGQTAQVGVISSQKENALSVPNAAVIRREGKSFVNVAGPDGQPTLKEFQPGMQGDLRTEVLGGLGEGDEILLPAPAPTTIGG